MVAELPSGRIHLQNDADSPGYCILVFKRHAVELFDLSETERAQFMEDIARVGSVVEEVCRPNKINVAMLGNACPHLHCHIKPRTFDDPQWGRAPIFTPPSSPLPPDEYARLQERFRAAFASIAT